MRKLFFMFLLGSFCMLIQAQTEDSKVFDVVEQMPAFPGGQSALFQWLSSNIKYPAEAEKNGVQGRVIVTFVVERDGSITETKVVRSVDPQLDVEAVRVIKSMPHWNPGKQNGSAVRVKYTLPLSFRLTAPAKTDSSSVRKDSTGVSPDTQTDKKALNIVEEMPSFPGGKPALVQWLSSNIKYPAKAEENGIQGRVIVSFTVERDGSITDVKVVKSVDPLLDEEAVRVTKSMPRWIAGKQQGKTIRVKYAMPLTFNLSGPAKSKTSQKQNYDRRTTEW